MNTSPNDKRRRLRALLAGPGLSVAPSCGDALTARLIESCGYPAVHCSGSDEEMRSARRQLNKPLIGVLQPAMTLAHYEQLGASIALLPARCRLRRCMRKSACCSRYGRAAL